MSEPSIDAALGEYKPTDYSVRLLEAVYDNIPGTPAYVHYGSVDDAVRALRASATDEQLAEARRLAAERDIRDVIWMASLLDTGDRGYAVYTGVRSALNYFLGDKSRGLENDEQQRNDAILKAFGVAYMVWKACPGTMAQKATAFRSWNAGQQLAIYYGAVEIALPFTDNALVAGGNFIGTMMSGSGDAAASRLATLAGGAAMTDAKSMLAAIIGPMEQVATKATRYIGPMAEAAKKYVPGVMTGVDKVAGVVASGADVLPIYRLLGARLAAESCARRALELGPA